MRDAMRRVAAKRLVPRQNGNVFALPLWIRNMVAGVGFEPTTSGL